MEIWEYHVLWILLLIFTSASLGQAPSSLRLVNLMFRHGDRNPVQIYPKAQNQESAWPEGLGQLTKLGIQQEYELGQFLRKRYNGYLNDTYHHQEIYVRSTDVDRTLMSGEAVLAGLYPPKDDQVWNKDIPWLPIPVHTIPVIEDILLGFSSCSKLEELQNSPNITKLKKDFMDKHSDFIHSLAQNTGANITNIQEVYYIFDQLQIENFQNKTHDPWVSNAVMKTLATEVIPFEFEMYKFTPEMVRLNSGGRVLADFIKTMKMRAENLLVPELKMILKSAHDTNILLLLQALRAFNNVEVPYSALIMVELHDGPVGHFVQVWYRNSTTEPPHLLLIPGCDSKNCSLDRFIEATKELTPVDLTRECLVEMKMSIFGLGEITAIVAVSCVFGVFFVILTVGITLCFHKKCQKRRTGRVRVYGKLRAERVPEEMPMINHNHGGSDLDE